MQGLALLCSLLALVFATPASAATPRLTGRVLVRNATFNGVANTMMYTVTATVDGTGADADHQAVVGFVSDDAYTACDDAATPWTWSQEQTYDTTSTRTWTLYHFVPGTAYHYKIVVGDPAGTTTRVKCGSLTTTMAPTPKLPPGLAALNIQYDAYASFETQYVLFETQDCSTGAGGYYLVVVDPVNEAIVWYLDVAAASGIPHALGAGLHYEPGPTPADDRIHYTVNKTLAAEWTFDGVMHESYDFGGATECGGVTGSVGPCLHHAQVRSDVTGNTYAITAALSGVDPTSTDWDAKCGSDSRFLDEGYLVLDGDWNVTDERYLMTDYGYDPTVDGGPDTAALLRDATACNSRHWSGSFDPSVGVIDWIHLNALDVSNFGADEMVDISSKEWSQIVRFDGATGDVVWKLSPYTGYTDWGRVRIASGVSGAASFNSQHDVHAVGPNTLMMVDNRGDTAGSRVLELELISRPLSATIQKSWMIVDGSGDPIRCPIEGTAQQVPGSTDDHVISACDGDYSISELTDPTGNTGTAPALRISLPDGTSEDFCMSGGPASRKDLQGWHKGYPLATVGEY